MVFRLHLARHGETLFNIRGQLQGWCDSPLTPVGRAQALQLADQFAEVDVSAILSSDLTRARETADSVASRHPDVDRLELRDLREWHYGGWEGQPNAALWSHVFAAHGRNYGEPREWDILTASGVDHVIDAIAASDSLRLAEGSLAVALRRDRAIATILAEGSRRGGELLVVSHGTMLASLIGELLPDAAPVRFPNVGVVSMDVDDSGPVGASLQASWLSTPSGPRAGSVGTIRRSA